MTPYYEQDGITIYHGDCREVLPMISEHDCIVTDPPYGLGDKWTGGTWFTRGVYNSNVSWDKEAPQDVINTLIDAGLPAIIWGGNYFNMPPSRCWFAWSKTNSVPTMADVELAWTNLDRPAKTHFHTCNGWARHHPTEKPIALMIWCLGFINGQHILDPFMGSGTTLVAAKELGRRAIGIEIDERYCEIAANRLGQGVLALDCDVTP